MTWFEELLMAFDYGFMWRALFVGIAVAISGAFIGPFLVLKRFSMIGHGLAHVAFAAVAIGLVTNQEPFIVTLILVVAASIFILKLNRSPRLQGDAAIALTAAVAMALGTVIASTAGGFNVDLFSYLFGSILTIQRIDVYLSITFAATIVVIVLLFYHDLFSLTYDEDFARISGVRARRLNTLLAVLIGVTIAVGIRAVGTLLISSLIIFPTIIALQFSRGFKMTILLAVLISTVNVLFGLVSSFLLDWPSGSTIVLLNGVVFMAIYGIRLLKPQN